MRETPPLRARLTAEAIGTAFLLAAVVGSGIMAERLAGGNVALALLANSLATAGALVALIFALGAVSGAHFNPAVTLVMVWRGAHPSREAAPYIGAQLLGAVAGVVAAHAMFELPWIMLSHHVRSGAAQWWSEAVASFGLVMVILGTARHRPGAMPLAVAAYILAAYWFTASTAFANPAVTLARALTDSFAGIRPLDAPGFIAAQLAGGLTAAWLLKPMFAEADA